MLSLWGCLGYSRIINSVNLQLYLFQGHAVSGFSVMNRMRIHSQLCDVKLKSGMVMIPAHKVVLASVSPYFHAMFNGRNKSGLLVVKCLSSL